MVGMESRKEKRAAVVRFMPSASPAVMVMPERDVPGISAMACASPMRMASFQPIVARAPRPKRSASPSRMPKKMDVQASSVAWRA